MSSAMLTAGVHTTAYQSTFLLFELAKNPEVQERLYQEIQSVVGERPPTAQDLEAMPYLGGCIKESLRVRTVTNLLARVLKKDAVIHGYYVPAGMARNFTLKTSKDDLKMIDNVSVTVDEDVPLYFTDRK
ncbi:probable cytochrome P450 49a1 [Halichondria panicea]|uniref:probable cytochrome P450 49a1 n=1 Tax=Halichondria panicea TaxID=6063 RepID=UPI00312B9E54